MGRDRMYSRYLKGSVIIGLVALLAACEKGAVDTTASHHENQKTVQTAAPRKYQEPKMMEPIQIQYGQASVEELGTGKPSDQLVEKRIVDLSQEKGLEPRKLRLYEKKDNKSTIYAFLEKDGQWIDLGLVSDKGIDSANPKLSHWGGPEQTELQWVALENNPNNPGMRIVYYDEELKKWIDQRFQRHSVAELDLDGDGKSELVGNHTTFVPPEVSLHRWNEKGGYFESAHLSYYALKSQNFDMENRPSYGFLFQDNGKWLLEAGTDQTYSFFQYEKGVIKAVNLTDTHSRFQDYLDAHKHNH